MSASPRSYLTTVLRPLCPPSWVWTKAQRMPDVLTRTTVVLKHAEIVPLPEAPIGWLSNTVVLSVFDPHADVVTAENALDMTVMDLICAVDGLGQIAWTKATKVVSPNEQYFGWDITLTVTTQKEA